MERTTIKQLQGLVDYINEITNSPTEHAIGHYFISNAYGGHKLERVTSKGTTDPLGAGYLAKQELYYRMWAYIRGLQDAK